MLDLSAAFHAAEAQHFWSLSPTLYTRIVDPSQVLGLVFQISLTVRGPVVARLLAETTGTDADWVVKLIDVFPDDYPTFEMSGYQLMVSADIFRGRYREDYDQPRPLLPSKPLGYTIPLPHVNHAFLPGDRLMVQIQSTWFPLYDRNPQTYVPTIMSAPLTAYRTQRHRIHHSATHATYLECCVDRMD